MLDGVVLSRKTGAGAVQLPVLVALGLHPDGKKEIIDYRLARGEAPPNGSSGPHLVRRLFRENANQGVPTLYLLTLPPAQTCRISSIAILCGIS
jgi:hypothetical protein